MPQQQRVHYDFLTSVLAGPLPQRPASAVSDCNAPAKLQKWALNIRGAIANPQLYHIVRYPRNSRRLSSFNGRLRMIILVGFYR